jgi:hypothetical protein
MGLWWGYIHENGLEHVKRFFSEEDLKEANESPFVSRVYGPWEAKDRNEALARLRKDHLKWRFPHDLPDWEPM